MLPPGAVPVGDADVLRGVGIYDMTHSYACVTRLIYLCDMTHSYSFMCHDIMASACVEVCCSVL